MRAFIEIEKIQKLHMTDSRTLFLGDPTIALMRARFTQEFFAFFNMGYQNYSEGEWPAARRFLMQTRNMLGVLDGPSCALIKVMEFPYKFKAPEGWQGTRRLCPYATHGTVVGLRAPESLAVPLRRTSDEQGLASFEVVSTGSRVAEDGHDVEPYDSVLPLLPPDPPQPLPPSAPLPPQK